MAVIALPLALSASGAFAAGTFAAAAAGTIAAGVGGAIDSMIFSSFGGGGNQQVQGPRLDNARISNSVEGSPILRAYGRNRVSGQLIWATRYLETEVTETQTVKGGKSVGGSRKQTTTTTTYQYSVSLAIAVCEGPIQKIGRIWADNKVMDLSNITYRIYKGTQSQTPDAKIVAVEGADFTPAYRGVSYIVFEDLPLAPYGNRIPQFNIEVYSYASQDPDELEFIIPGFNIIPGAGEYTYGTTPVTSNVLGDNSNVGWNGANVTANKARKENQNSSLGEVDWAIAMDDLQALAPNVETASLVVTWFGDDLRMQNCTVKPKVETQAKTFASSNDQWWVNGVVRTSADIVSADELGPLIGGTPSDRTVFQAIQDLNSRGLRTVFYPFIIMDIPAGNTLPNPYSNNAVSIGQPTFPWRGRIVPSPAPGFTGSIDKTASAATAVSNFFGTCVGANFGAWNGVTIPYSGPNEWTFRRQILHYAKLCAAAGGVDIFCIGTEMVGLTRTRSNATTFPAVTALKTLAADVKAILPGAQLTYAADWSEWHHYDPADGSGDLFFHLDPLWSDSNISYVAIDNYMPTTDWRDVPGHLDAANYDFIYDLNYHLANVAGGELFDWYYASQTDRLAQTRTPITDGAYSKPWVYKNKDIKNWWLNLHYNRPGGVESGSPTNWAAQSKPIMFTEIGCPNVDKGSNQPNVFYDPKSSESFFPYFSSGARDDYISRVYIEAWLRYYLNPANNPTSTVYSQAMLYVTHTCIWTWDARPFPEFPLRQEVWRDGPNWRLGHWWDGRLGAVSLPSLVNKLVEGLGVTVDTSTLFGLVLGYTLDRPMSARDAILNLQLIYQFDVYQSGSTIKFRHRGGKVNWTITEADLIPLDDISSYYITRQQETELPAESIITFIEETADYLTGSVQSKRQIGQSQQVADSQISMVADRELIQVANDINLLTSWLQREKLEISLSPKYIGIEPSDIIEMTFNGSTSEWRVDSVNNAFQVELSLSKTDRGLYYRISTAEVVTAGSTLPAPVTTSTMDFVELPLLADDDNVGGPRIAIFASPWQSNSLFRSPTTSNYALDTIIATPSFIGVVNNAVSEGPEDVWDYGTELTVQMFSEAVLSSKTDLEVFNGSNSAAIKADNDEWEIIQWSEADLIGDRLYKLTKLLRARLGTDDAMRAGATAGAQFVLLDGLKQSTVGVAQRNLLLNWKFGPSARSLDDTSYRTVSYAPKAVGLRPYSPVHLGGEKEISGDITLTWTRRTRLPESGDTWEGLDIPLGEELELYEVDIFNALGTAVLRTLQVTTQTTVYTSAQQTTDFGSPLTTSIIIEVFQLSNLYGRGTGRKETITL